MKNPANSHHCSSKQQEQMQGSHKNKVQCVSCWHGCAVWNATMCCKYQPTMCCEFQPHASRRITPVWRDTRAPPGCTQGRDVPGSRLPIKLHLKQRMLGTQLAAIKEHNDTAGRQSAHSPRAAGGLKRRVDTAEADHDCRSRLDHSAT